MAPCRPVTLQPNEVRPALWITRVAQPPSASDERLVGVFSEVLRRLLHSRGRLCHMHFIRLKCYAGLRPRHRPCRLRHGACSTGSYRGLCAQPPRERTLQTACACPPLGGGMAAEAGKEGSPESFSSAVRPSRARLRGEARGLARGQRNRCPTPSPSQKAGPSDGRVPPPQGRSATAHAAPPFTSLLWLWSETRAPVSPQAGGSLDGHLCRRPSRRHGNSRTLGWGGVRV